MGRNSTTKHNLFPELYYFCLKECGSSLSVYLRKTPPSDLALIGMLSGWIWSEFLLSFVVIYFSAYVCYAIWLLSCTSKQPYWCMSNQHMTDAYPLQNVVRILFENFVRISLARLLNLAVFFDLHCKDENSVKLPFGSAVSQLFAFGELLPTTCPEQQTSVGSSLSIREQSDIWSKGDEISNMNTVESFHLIERAILLHLLQMSFDQNMLYCLQVTLL